MGVQVIPIPIEVVSIPNSLFHSHSRGIPYNILTTGRIPAAE